MSAARAGDRDDQTLGARLTWVRLTRRAAQLELILQCLRHRARADDAGVVERTGLRRASEDFARELEQIQAQLDGRATRPPGSVSSTAPPSGTRPHTASGRHSEHDSEQLHAGDGERR